MVVNDNACLLAKRGALSSMASELAPTISLTGHHYTIERGFSVLPDGFIPANPSDPQLPCLAARNIGRNEKAESCKKQRLNEPLPMRVFRCRDFAERPSRRSGVVQQELRMSGSITQGLVEPGIQLIDHHRWFARITFKG